MSVPSLTPISQVSAITLPATGSHARVTPNLPFGIYAHDTNFISGAVDQVAFTYKMLGGDVLDIELTESNIYAAYETAILEYSYIINIHQSKNVMSSVIGSATGTFNHDGELLAGALSSSLNGQRIELLYTSFDYKTLSTMAGEAAGVGGNLRHYSASINLIDQVQEYDIQGIIESSSSGSAWDGQLGGKKVTIRRVFYKSPISQWRFFGSYGVGLGAVGEFGSFNQYSNDSTFDITPVWQNKLQAMAFEEHMHTRVSHYSYEIQNNRIKLYPIPRENEIDRKLWFTFTIPNNTSFNQGFGFNGIAAQSDSSRLVGGVNNINTLPFANIPFANINSIGKQWIRRYALAVAKQILGQIRSKFSIVPIPGESITLNGDALLGQAKDEQAMLKEELQTILKDLTYAELAKQSADLQDLTSKFLEKIPMAIFVG